MAQNATEEAKKRLPQLHIKVEGIEVQEGSINISIVVSSIALDPTGITSGALLIGTITLWVADKLLGGAIEEYGKWVASSIYNRLFGQEPLKICDPQKIAEETAKKVAEERRGRHAICFGPTSINGTLQYIYELIECDNARRVVIDVDKFCKTPPRVQVV